MALSVPSRIVLGNMSWPGCGFGPVPSADELPELPVAERLVAAALDAGVTTFDTAEAYGCGRGEDLLGEALARLGRRDETFLVTKVGPVFGDEQTGGRRCFLTRDHILARCEASLRRLRTDRLDLYLAHWPDPLAPLEETMGAFEALRRRGLIRASGVSNFTPAALDRSAELGNVSRVQAAYSLVERFSVEAELRPVCVRRNLTLMAYSPLGKGLLSAAAAAGKLPARHDYRHGEWHFLAENLDRHLVVARQLHSLALELRVTASQLALAWCLHQPLVGSVVVGCRTEEQVADAAGAAEVRLPADVLARLDAVSNPAARPRG